MRIADKGNGIGTTTSRPCRKGKSKDSFKQNGKHAKQLWDNFGCTVRDGILDRSLEIDEDLTAFLDTLCQM